MNHQELETLYVSGFNNGWTIGYSSNENISKPILEKAKQICEKHPKDVFAKAIMRGLERGIQELVKEKDRINELNTITNGKDKELGRNK